MELPYYREVVATLIDLPRSEVTVALTCGHEMTFTVATHPVFHVDALDISLGDQMWCDQCRPGMIH